MLDVMYRQAPAYGSTHPVHHPCSVADRPAGRLSVGPCRLPFGRTFTLAAPDGYAITLHDKA